MSYLWNEFNIKTFAAQTVVYRDGVFCPELSTIAGTDFRENFDKPIHIIYVGEIAGENRLGINIYVENQPVFLTAKIKNKKPAFFNIFIKNAGKNSEFRGHVMLENSDNLKFNCTASHDVSDTTILVKTKLIAERNSISKLSGTAIIEKNCPNTTSDIGFSILADKSARIEISPAQCISSVPDAADHSASIYQPTAPQIEYLRGAGLSGAEVDTALREAFMNDFNLF